MKSWKISIGGRATGFGPGPSDRVELPSVDVQRNQNVSCGPTLSIAGMKIGTLLFVLCVAIAFAYANSAHTESLPEGNSGIAARHPGDAGIATDPAVIFADDFESYGNAFGLTRRWSEAHGFGNIRIASEPGNHLGSRNALEFTVPKQGSEVTVNLTKHLKPGRDVLFLRFYAKFDSGFDVLGSSHNGGTISARYCCPGERADGINKFSR